VGSRRRLLGVGMRMRKAEKEMDFDFVDLNLNFAMDLVDIVKSTNKMIKTIPEHLRVRLRQRKERMLTRAHRLWKRLEDAKTKKLLHKICFLVLFFDIIISSFLVGARPSYFYACHTVKLIVMLLLRFVHYRMKRHHYYLFDFCYWANFILLIYVWCAPSSLLVWRAVFTFGGTLGNSVVLFRNSLVPHSLDKVTTAEVHFSPLVVLWTLRWFPPSDTSFVVTPDTLNTPFFSSWSTAWGAWWSYWLEVFPPAFMLYVVWAAPYYGKMFIWSADKIERKKYATLYKYMALDRGILYKLPRRLQPHAKLIFILCHLGIFLGGAVYTPILYHSYWCHTLWLLFLLAVIIFNGAQFYIDYFAKHYESSLAVIEHLQSSIEHAANSPGGPNHQLHPHPTQRHLHPPQPHVGGGHHHHHHHHHNHEDTAAPDGSPSAAAAAAVTGEDKASPSPPITVTMPEGGEQANPNSGSPPLQAVSS